MCMNSLWQDLFREIIRPNLVKYENQRKTYEPYRTSSAAIKQGRTREIADNLNIKGLISYMNKTRYPTQCGVIKAIYSDSSTPKAIKNEIDVLANKLNVNDLINELRWKHIPVIDISLSEAWKQRKKKEY